MSNFDFLKNFNDDLYELGVKLEGDVINSPRAVTADATLFLESLVKDIYRLSGKKLEKNLISFYKKIDNLYRLGIISYIYKNKLRDAYNLRNRIHENYKDSKEEAKLAFDLHQRLYYISKKYFNDFCDNQNHINVPDYKKPEHKDIHFDNCIICGRENMGSASNMCDKCNQKIDNVNVLLSIQNTFDDANFTKEDLISYGLSESETNCLLRDLSMENVILNKAKHYMINDAKFKKLFEEADQYIEIGLLLTKFYNDEISANEIKSTLEYWKGGINQKNYVEFYRLVNLKLEKDFEKNLLKFEDVKKSMKNSSMDNLIIKDWFMRRRDSFIDGELNDAFILFNELLIKRYFDLKKKNLDDVKIREQMDISDDILEFWKNHFKSEEFLKRTNEIKKDLILKEVKKNKSLFEVFKSAGISQREFNRLYLSSKKSDDEFHRQFDRHYTQKRQKTFIKHLKRDNLNKSIKITKITREEFFRWYYEGEGEYSDFYLKVTQILMDKYLEYRNQGWRKKDILNRLNIPKELVKSWSEHDDLEFINDFQVKNREITKNLVKRGKIINALKEDKSKTEAIYSADMTPKEFLEIYNTSNSLKTYFHIRFDIEYEKNRKRLFPKVLKDNDFYNTIRICEITQKQFNLWYAKDQDAFIASSVSGNFYIETTRLLMDKYIRARMDGKNRPDAAKSVGLSNAVIDKWLNHAEFSLFWNFKKKNDELEKRLVMRGFWEMKSKREVSEIYDVSLKTINDFLDFGKRGLIEFKKLFDLYENHVVPNFLGTFLDNVKTKAFNKSLKNSKLTEKELDYYYGLGKSGNNKFQWFYDSYLKIKINLYLKSILSKKSHKIALKNSNLTADEYEENKSKIEDMLLEERFEIIYGEIGKFKSTGTKLAKLLGIDVEEIYEWYFKGKHGHSRFREFALIFEIGVILPRVIVFHQAKSSGVPKNRLYKRIKNELGLKEYQIWQHNDLIDQLNYRNINIKDSEDIDGEKIRKIFRDSDIIAEGIESKDREVADFLKKVFISRFGINAGSISIPVAEFYRSEAKGK